MNDLFAESENYFSALNQVAFGPAPRSLRDSAAAEFHLQDPSTRNKADSRLCKNAFSNQQDSMKACEIKWRFFVYKICVCVRICVIAKTNSIRVIYSTYPIVLSIHYTLSLFLHHFRTCPKDLYLTRRLFALIKNRLIKNRFLAYRL